MINILLYVSNGLILISLFFYLILILISKNKKITNETGFDITKNIISEFDRINIIASNGKITYYNPKRKVIRLNNNCYYGNDVSSIAVSLVEAGISVIDDGKNKIINFFKIFFSNIKMVYLFSLVAIVVNIVSSTSTDAKVSLVIMTILIIFIYLYISILNASYNWIYQNINKIKLLNKKNNLKVMQYINYIIIINKGIFLGELLIVIRMVAIILDFKL